MQEVSRQKKVEVLLGYVRSAELFDDHAGSEFLYRRSEITYNARELPAIPYWELPCSHKVR